MDLTSLCQSLSLSDDEEFDVCDLGTIAREAGVQKVVNSLFGKVLSTKRVSREGFISTMSFVWRTKEPMVVEMIGINQFVIHFGSMEDKIRVLGGGPWNLEDWLIALENPSGLGDHNDAKFDTIPFWVQIHNLSLLCQNREAGRSLGAQIGSVEEVDPGASEDCLGKFIRVRVKVDITKPLKKGLRVKVDDTGNTVIALLRYERLPSLCFNCGIVGHPILECQKAKHGNTNAYKFNEFIIAGPIQRFNNHNNKRYRTCVDGEIKENTGMKNQVIMPLVKKTQTLQPLKMKEVDQNMIREIGGSSGEKRGSIDSPLTKESNKIRKDQICDLNSQNGRFLMGAKLVEITVDKETEDMGANLLARIRGKEKRDDEPKFGPNHKVSGKIPLKDISNVFAKEIIEAPLLKGQQKDEVLGEDLVGLSSEADYLIGEGTDGTVAPGGKNSNYVPAAVSARQDCRDL
ncbi:uncharacterized protein LOC126668481 [Mercurialis annua]|uniref:uncharacterized protein LOC126668481 n=1 Tax=Mercurialis annua TaxID=3986 RepID=UPI002160E012|nr:uncharacterized protein LOC126668481 [Mercurialis annua]